jgi:hypothetical protein
MAGALHMKRSFQCRSNLLLVVVALSVVASATVKAGASGPISRSNAAADNAQLVVWRAADFGYWISLILYIDGVQLTRLGWNEGYQAVVRPGEHVLSIVTTPSPYGKTRVTYHRVHMKRGETYAFTALWKEAQLPILESGHVRVATGW